MARSSSFRSMTSSAFVPVNGDRMPSKGAKKSRSSKKTKASKQKKNAASPKNPTAKKKFQASKKVPAPKGAGQLRASSINTSNSSKNTRRNEGMTPKEVLKHMKEQKAVAIDFKFNDFLGIWQHFT